MEQGLRNYLVVTGGYWAFTVTDGAIRMLVVLYLFINYSLSVDVLINVNQCE
ncbi:MAG: hypothetical protein K1565_20205 [Candidatus Thiodiazotropha sp. (ex. Lucinisca nassula)]|nr:hypothetical protein [Candidatus Thiodiazotropha sp. (ex. Lucinisca nassula)]